MNIIHRAYRFITQADKKESQARYEELRRQRRSEGARKGHLTRKANLAAKKTPPVVAESVSTTNQGDSSRPDSGNMPSSHGLAQ